MRVRVTGGWLVRNNVILAIANKVKDKFKQLWTTNQVPDGEKVKHDFKDGKGEVDAVPYDEIGLSTEVIKAAKRAAMAYGQDSVGLTTKVSDAKLELGVAFGSDQVSITNTVIDTFRTPNPVILTTINDVPDRIAEVVPAKTEAMPDGAFKFLIKYVEGYSYVEGDIWVSAGTLSDDGNYLTVSSPENLEITLILAPDPQEWLLEAPSESAIQEATDRQLPDIPRDGNIARYSIEDAELSDFYFFTNILNSANTFVTNLTNNTFYTTTNHIYNVNFTFAPGYDYNDIDIYVFNYGDSTDEAVWVNVIRNVYLDTRCIVDLGWNDTNNKLIINNINADISVKIEIDERYKNTFKVDDAIEMLQDVKSYELNDYFYLIDLNNSATDYVTSNSSYTTPRVGNSASFLLTYKTGYDNNDVKVSSENPNLEITNEMTSNTTSKIVVSNISSDELIKIGTNDENKKYTTISDDLNSLIFDIKSFECINYFYYAIVTNTVPNIFTLEGASSNVSYKTVSPNGIIKIKCTFADGYDINNVVCSDGGAFIVENGVSYLTFGPMVDDIIAKCVDRPQNIYQSIEWDEGRNEAVEFRYDMNSIELNDYFFIGVIENIATHITLSGITDGYILQRKGEPTVLIPTFDIGYNSSDFIVSIGTLTNSGWEIPALSSDSTIFIMDDDYHDPKSIDLDDLGIFTDTDNNSYGQYRIVEGDGTIVTSYSVINNQSARMENRSIFGFKSDEIDLINWDVLQEPGNVHTYWVSDDANVINEVITECEVDGKMLWRHDIELKRQVVLEVGKQYIFKVRGSNQLDNTVIAYAKNTEPANIVCSNDEHYLDGIRYYMAWNSPNFIIRAMHLPYLEINLIKI